MSIPDVDVHPVALIATVIVLLRQDDLALAFVKTAVFHNYVKFLVRAVGIYDMHAGIIESFDYRIEKRVYRA